MPEVAAKIFPHEIDMSWTVENPGAGSDVGGHLVAYRQARIDWAEATQEAWTVQHQAAGLRDEATTLLGGVGQNVSGMLRAQSRTEWRSRHFNEGLSIRTELVPVFLGRTSLALAGDINERHLTVRNGWTYTYGVGLQAKRARELESVLTASAEAAAASLLQDSQVDPEVAAVWHSVLTAKEMYAQLDPACFAEAALKLVMQAKSKLSKVEWLALIGRYDLQIEASSSSAPLGIVAVGGSLQLASAQTAGRTFAHAQGNDRDDSRYPVSNWLVIPAAKKRETINLLDDHSVGATPETSFDGLRDIIERERDPKARRLFLPADAAHLNEPHQRSTRLAAVLALHTLGFENRLKIDDEKAGIVGELAEALHYQVDPPSQPARRPVVSGRWGPARRSALPGSFRGPALARAPLAYLRELTQALHISRGDVEAAIQQKYSIKQEPGSLAAIAEQERSAEVLQLMMIALDAIFTGAEPATGEKIS